MCDATLARERRGIDHEWHPIAPDRRSPTRSVGYTGSVTLRVLCIEDDDELADNLGELLAAEGFVASFAATGRDGIRAALGETPDLVVCDFVLPDMDGCAVMRAVRASRDVPFIFVTGRADEGAAEHAMRSGADAYLTKPFACAALVATIRTRLARD